jgi:acetyl-CoA acetyltransferase
MDRRQQLGWSPAPSGGRAAMGKAGIGPADVTMCQIYDCYTYTVLVTLEDYGFCAKGEGPLAASGALARRASLPVNTGGGQLSAYYMWGSHRCLRRSFRRAATAATVSLRRLT